MRRPLRIFLQLWKLWKFCKRLCIFWALDGPDRLVWSRHRVNWCCFRTYSRLGRLAAASDRLDKPIAMGGRTQSIAGSSKAGLDNRRGSAMSSKLCQPTCLLRYFCINFSACFVGEVGWNSRFKWSPPIKDIASGFFSYFDGDNH